MHKQQQWLYNNIIDSMHNLFVHHTGIVVIIGGVCGGICGVVLIAVFIAPILCCIIADRKRRSKPRTQAVPKG